MKKLSQRELLDEGFANMLKSLARGAAGLAKGTAKMISPTAAGLAKGAADKIGGAAQNLLSSPEGALKDYFNRPQVKAVYDNFKITNTKKGGNAMSRQIEISARDIKTGKVVTGTVNARRDDEGGLAAETWGFDSITLSNGEVIGDRGGVERSRQGLSGIKDTLDGLPQKGDPFPGEDIGAPAPPVAEQPGEPQTQPERDLKGPHNTDNVGNQIKKGDAVKWTGKGGLQTGRVIGFDGDTGQVRVKHSKGSEFAMKGEKLFLMARAEDLQPENEESKKSQKSLLKHLQSWSS